MCMRGFCQQLQTYIRPAKQRTKHTEEGVEFEGELFVVPPGFPHKIV